MSSRPRRQAARNPIYVEQPIESDSDSLPENDDISQDDEPGEPDETDYEVEDASSADDEDVEIEDEDGSIEDPDSEIDGEGQDPDSDLTDVLPMESDDEEDMNSSDEADPPGISGSASKF